MTPKGHAKPASTHVMGSPAARIPNPAKYRSGNLIASALAISARSRGSSVNTRRTIDAIAARFTSDHAAPAIHATAACQPNDVAMGIERIKPRTIDDLRTRRRKSASSEEKTAAPLGRISITLVSVVLGVRPLQDDRDFANARGESENQKYDGECG